MNTRPLTAVDDGHGHQDPRPTSQSAHHVGSETQQSQRRTSEGRGGRDDPLQLLVDASLSVSGNDHLLVLELLGDLSRTGTRDFDPGLAKDGTGRDDKEDVEDGVQGVEQGRGDASGSRDVVGETGDGFELTRGFFHGLRRSPARI